MARQLTVELLLASGFLEVGCWELNSARDLHHRIKLPGSAGVYAFAVNGVAQYVGLASTSVRHRLSFYRKPGASQRTNVRLNEIIRGQLERGTTVQILIAHPDDSRWNGLLIKGAEGLEAGLIQCFDLPWNMRGTQRSVVPADQRAPLKTKGTTVAAQILEHVRRRSGMTEIEIATTIYGPGALQQQVNHDCRLLVDRGLLKRHGRGGRSDPYTYSAIV
jgi:hypothetical protein